MVLPFGSRLSLTSCVSVLSLHTPMRPFLCPFAESWLLTHLSSLLPIHWKREPYIQIQMNRNSTHHKASCSCMHAAGSNAGYVNSNNGAALIRQAGRPNRHNEKDQPPHEAQIQGPEIWKYFWWSLSISLAKYFWFYSHICIHLAYKIRLRNCAHCFLVNKLELLIFVFGMQRMKSTIYVTQNFLLCSSLGFLCLSISEMPLTNQ